jgi:predicted transcriptional regulator
MDAKAEAVLKQYQEDVKRWQENNAHYMDIRPIAINDALYMKAVLHPTNKAESKNITKQLVEFICEREIVTAKEIYDALGLSDKPVLKRLKAFKELGLVRREAKKYYLPTPRMMELKKRYLRRICS